MPDWSIKFVPAKHHKDGVLADFVLDVPGDPSGPFDVFTGDVVSCNNTTKDDHWPAVYAPGGDGGAPPAGDPEPIGERLKQRQSSPLYVVSGGTSVGTTIWFCCNLHRKEVGKLKVVAPGTAPTV